MNTLLIVVAIVCLTVLILALCGIDVKTALKFLGIGLSIETRDRRKR